MKSQQKDSCDLTKSIFLDIAPVFAITVLVAFYNLCIDSLNYLYWFLHDRTWLGFKSSPIDTPLLKAVLFICLLLALLYYWKNYKIFYQGKDIKGLAVINIIVLCSAIYFWYLFGFYSIEDLNDIILKGDNFSILLVFLWNLKALIAIIVVIVLFVVVLFLGKRFKFSNSNEGKSQLALTSSLLALPFLSFCIGTIYVIYSFLSVHQNLVQNKNTAKYVVLSDNTSIYPLYCEEDKCFGYEVITLGGDGYNTSYRTYKLDEIIK